MDVKFDIKSGVGVVVGNRIAATLAVTGKGKGNYEADRKKSVALNEKSPDGDPWVNWGDQNIWPQNAIDTIEGNDILSRIMADRTAIHYGKGLRPFVEELDENGARVVKMVQDDEINEWLEANSVNSLYLPGVISDYERFKIIFPQLVLSADRKKINRIFWQPTSSIRWAKQDPKSMLTRNVYLCHFWEDASGVDDTKMIPALDPYYPMEDIEARAKEFSFIFPCSLPSGKNRYYPVPCWYAAVKMGWVDISNTVPSIKKAIFKNQITLKYHIQIPFDYWSKKYQNWDGKLDNERTQLISDELTGLMDVLQATDQAGKAFISQYGLDQLTGKETPGWKITPIDDQLKDGAYIPDSQEAASHILWAGGLDPSIVGVAAPGGKMGAGSGSDKRESYWIHTAKLGIDHQITLSPFYFIARYNGWSTRIKGLKWGYVMEDTSPTLDKNPNGKQNALG